MLTRILIGNVKGDKGDDGRGISKIEKAASSGLVDTYTATFSDGTAAGSFTVTNGAKGDKGEKGDTGPQGPNGATGPTGATGATGQRGSQWYSGTAVTGTSTTGAVFSTGISSALVGDYYLNTSTGAVYRCTVSGAASAAKWAYAGSIKGATGAQGPQGPKGLKGDTGATGPTGAQGATGPQGPRGNTGPQGIQGVKGDTGAKGEKGDAGITVPISGLFSLGVDDAGNLVAYYSDAASSAPKFEYDKSTGNVYYII